MFVHPEGNIANNPHLSAIGTLLIERGHGVAVRGPRGPFSRLNNSEVQGIEVSPFLQRLLLSLSSRPATWWPTKVLIARCQTMMPPADVVIGIDRQGLVEGAVVASMQKIPLVYLSYEIFFSGECSAKFKAVEREAASTVSFAISQDARRAQLLSDETGIPLDRIVNMPVAGRSAQPSPRTYLLHEEFGIPEHKKIAIAAGSIADWTASRDLVAGLASWPEDWALVMHDRYGAISPWQRQAQSHHPDRLYLSRGGFAALEDLGRFLHAADLGIALYRPTFDSIYTGNNVANIGMSSGKIATYLQHGLPVLTNEIGEMTEHIRRSGLGLVASSFADIPGLLRKFDPEPMRKRCLCFFSERLDATMHIQLLESALLHSLGTKKVR